MYFFSTGAAAIAIFASIAGVRCPSSAAMRLREFMSALLRVSEKAAVLARAVRSERELFALLVEEKTGEDANKRFLKDFKTLADVLIQETVRHDIGNEVRFMVVL